MITSFLQICRYNVTDYRLQVKWMFSCIRPGKQRKEFSEENCTFCRACNCDLLCILSFVQSFSRGDGIWIRGCVRMAFYSLFIVLVRKEHFDMDDYSSDISKWFWAAIQKEGNWTTVWRRKICVPESFPWNGTGNLRESELGLYLWPFSPKKWKYYYSRIFV